MLSCCAMHVTGSARRACALQESCAPALQHISLVMHVMRLVGGKCACKDGAHAAVAACSSQQVSCNAETHAAPTLPMLWVK